MDDTKMELRELKMEPDGPTTTVEEVVEEEVVDHPHEVHEIDPNDPNAKVELTEAELHDAGVMQEVHEVHETEVLHEVEGVEGVVPGQIQIAIPAAPKARKKAVHLPTEQKARLYAEIKVIATRRSMGAKVKKGELQALAAKYNVSRNYPSKLLKDIDNGRTFQRKQGTGRPRVMTEDKIAMLMGILARKEPGLTYRELGDEIGVSARTVRVFMIKNKLKFKIQHKKRMPPKSEWKLKDRINQPPAPKIQVVDGQIQEVTTVDPNTLVATTPGGQPVEIHAIAWPGHHAQQYYTIEYR